MSDLFDGLIEAQEADSGNWYAVVAASPRPDAQERVNVAIAIGNGAVTQLRYLERLPRLRCIAAVDEINVYEAVLESLAIRLKGSAMDTSVLKGVLGPQMEIREPRKLYRTPTPDVVDGLVQRFLAPPIQPPKVEREDALIQHSSRKLDAVLYRAKPRGVLVQKDVHPRNLYEGKLERHVPFKVPSLARAMRGMGRDVLIDSLVVEQDYHSATVSAAAARIARAFFAYDAELRPVIKTYAARDIRLIGVLQPSQDTSSDTLNLRDFIRDMWEHHADEVIEGREDEIERALRVHGEWVAGT